MQCVIFAICFAGAISFHFTAIYADELRMVPARDDLKIILPQDLVIATALTEFPINASSVIQISDEVVPPSPQPMTDATAETEARLFRPSIPARKMTIRRDPLKNRFLGNDQENGKSIRAIQEELNSPDRFVALADEESARFSQTGWSADPQYGRYIYIHHAPLLFEDIPAERYGEEIHPYIQPVVSFTKFMGTIPILPYKITTDYYAAYHENAWVGFDYQGNMRPGILDGSFLPSAEVIRQYPRANLAGALAEGGIIAGLFFILP